MDIFYYLLWILIASPLLLWFKGFRGLSRRGQIIVFFIKLLLSLPYIYLLVFYIAFHLLEFFSLSALQIRLLYGKKTLDFIGFSLSMLIFLGALVFSYYSIKKIYDRSLK